MIFFHRFRRLLPLAIATLASGCSLATPFKSGPAAFQHEGSVFIGVTNARVEGGNRRAFDKHTRLVIRSLGTHEGYMGHSVRSRLLGNEVWTMTVWKDEASLDRFVRSPVHREAMREGTPQVLTAKFDRFEWPSLDSRPTWTAILKRLESVEAVEYAARRTQAQNSPDH